MKKSFNFAKLAIPAALAAMLMVPGVSHATCSVGAASALPYVVSAAGGVGTVTLSAPAGCRWTFNARGSAWIRILGPAAGSGSAVVTYQILPNTPKVIAEQLSQGRPLLAEVRTHGLGNPHYPGYASHYEETGWSVPHFVTIIGYDKTGVWLNDPGITLGRGYHITYAQLTHAIADLGQHHPALNNGNAGGLSLLGKQAIGVAAAGAWAAVVTFVLLKAIDLLLGLRVDTEIEHDGLDGALHGESAYGSTNAGAHGT